MYESLQKLARLPQATRVYCGHEYTLSNIRFARAVEPDNADLAARQRDCERQREKGEPTVPSTMAVEQATNPFLRCDSGPGARGRRAAPSRGRVRSGVDVRRDTRVEERILSFKRTPETLSSSLPYGN